MRELVVYGVGELGKLLAGAALRCSIRVTPITRATPAAEVFKQVDPGTPLLISVAESDLDAALRSVPETHRSAVILLQNELFPSVWQAHRLTPTVLVPWVLQKPGVPTQVARVTPVFGPRSALIGELLAALSIPYRTLNRETELIQALVDKYAFILTVNALGLAVDRTLGMWLQEDPAQVWDVCDEAIALGEALAGNPVDPAEAHIATQEALIALSRVPARGRTARERVRRALEHATRLGLELPTLTRIGVSSGL